MTKDLTKKSNLAHYSQLLDEIKNRIRQGQTRAILSANAEMIQMYWDIGKILAERQNKAGWGKQVIPRLSKDLRNELTEVKGFSERNMGRMIAFYRAYPDLNSILPQPVAKLAGGQKAPQVVAKLDPEFINIINMIPYD